MIRMLLALLAAALLGVPASHASVRPADLVRKESALLRDLPSLNAKAKGMQLDGAGKARLIFFWASWCPYCKQAMADLLRDYTQWLDRGAMIQVVSVDDTREAAQAFLDKTPMRMPVWWGGERAKKAFRVSTLPTILLVGEDGRIVSEYAGYSGERFNYLRKRLGSLLKVENEDD